MKYIFFIVLLYYIIFQILDFHLENHFFNFKLRGFCVHRDQLLKLQMRVSFICLGSVSLALFGQILISLCIADSSSSVQIHWYIMTSPFTDEATRKFFESHKFFGLEAEQVRCLNLFHVLLVLVLLLFTYHGLTSLIQVTFFQQGTIPCVSKDGRFIMETPYRVYSHSLLSCKYIFFSFLLS